MAKTTFILEADEAKAVQAFLKLAEAQGKATDEVRKFNREGDNFGKGMVSGIGGIAAGFGIATGAVELTRKTIGLLVKELEDMRRKESEAAKTTADYAKTFSETIGDWLGAEKIDKAHAALTRVVKEIPELSYTTGEAMLGAYAKAKPKAGLERGIEAVKLAAPLAWGRVETAKLVGELEEIFPEKTMEDLFDIAVGLRKRAGKHKEEIEEGLKAVHRMMAVGIPGEQAMGVLMAAFEEEQAGRAVQAMTKLPLEFGKPVVRIPGRPLTEEQKIQKETAGMTEAEIFNWALANPEKVKKVLGTSWAMVAPIMKPGAVTEWTRTVGTIQTENEYQKQLAAQRASFIATQPRIEMRRGAAEELQKMGNVPGAITGFTRKATEDLLKTMPEMGYLQRKGFMLGTEFFGRMPGADYAKVATERLEALRREPEYLGVEGKEAIGGLIRDIREMAAAMKGMGGLGQREDVFKELQAQTKLLNTLIEISRPDLALRMIGVNTGMVD